MKQVAENLYRLGDAFILATTEAIVDGSLADTADDCYAVFYTPILNHENRGNNVAWFLIPPCPLGDRS